MPLIALVFTWPHKTGFLIFSCPDLVLKVLQGWVINKQINSYGQQAGIVTDTLLLSLSIITGHQNFKGNKVSCSRTTAVNAACVLVSIWLQHAERGNACSHWQQPTRGQFSQHSAELAGKKCVLHSSVLLPSQMENSPLGRQVNAVGIVWEIPQDNIG